MTEDQFTPKPVFLAMGSNSFVVKKWKMISGNGLHKFACWVGLKVGF